MPDRHFHINLYQEYDANQLENYLLSSFEQRVFYFPYFIIYDLFYFYIILNSTGILKFKNLNNYFDIFL